MRGRARAEGLAGRVNDRPGPEDSPHASGGGQRQRESATPRHAVVAHAMRKNGAVGPAG